jgi:hypothetical protein
MIVKRRNGGVAKVLSAVYALLWLAPLVYFVIRRIFNHSAFMDFTNFFAAGFITAVTAFASVLSYYSRDAGYTGLQRAAVICAFVSNIRIILIIPMFICGLETAIYIDLAISAALFAASIVLMIISRVKTKKEESNYEQ